LTEIGIDRFLSSGVVFLADPAPSGFVYEWKKGALDWE
jgi:NADH:ubiquinone oxidoreductase subunit 3 (subunit A)